MKIQIGFYGILLGVFIVVGCGKDRIIKRGTASAIDYEGNLWTAELADFDEEEDGLIDFRLSNFKGGVEEDLLFDNFERGNYKTSFNIIPERLSLLSTEKSVRLRTHLGGDGHTEDYTFFEEEMFISGITIEDRSQNEICGTFEVSVAISDWSGPQFHNLPDTLFFTDGKFCAKRQKQ